MTTNNEMQRIVEELDVPAIQRFRAEFEPHLMPMDDKSALIALHMARTAAESSQLKLRAYSHAWLAEQGYPSMLPDNLKAKATRLYPSIAEAVGISVTFRNKIFEPATGQVEKAMGDVVEEAYSTDRKTKVDPDVLRPRILAAKDKEFKKLFGSTRLH